ncbi:MAG TPA: nucleotidyltransferase domain-containing protein [Rhodanobacteraceae bacterium]|nr:nucleotidyltransferase domain-containing protein [Rhodanobacteraceae bacterium]
MDTRPETLVGAAREALLREFPELIGAWMFGSAASGSLRAESDIDLAVWCGAPVPGVRRWEAERELGVMLDRDVDLIDLASAGTLIAVEIFTKGLVLVERDAQAVLDLHARTLSDYAELMDATRAIREAARRTAWRSRRDGCRARLPHARHRHRRVHPDVRSRRCSPLRRDDRPLIGARQISAASFAARPT